MAARDIQFVVKARDEASRAFDTISQALADLVTAQGQLGSGSGKVNANLSQIIQTLGRFDAVSKTIFQSSDQATAAFDRQSAKVQQLESKLANLKAQASSAAGAMAQIKGAAAATGGTADAASVKAIETAQNDLQRQIQRTTKDLDNQRTTLNDLRNEAQKLASLANATDAAGPGVQNAQEQAAAAKAMEEQAAAAERIRDQLNPTLAIQKRYAAEIAAIRANTLLSDKERLAAEKLLNAEMKREIASAGRGEGGRPSFLGLKPYELTNLGYQVNDIVSGLASGQGIMQIIAQQGGQVLQLMPRLGASVLAALTNPAVLAAAVTFGTIAYAIKQAADQAERLRQIGAVLRANADGARYSADAINDNVKALENYHLSAEDALTISKTFIKEGLNPSKFEEFGMAAKDMSRVFGTDVKKAAEDLATAFNGGYNALAKFDDENNILTAGQRDTVKKLMESGHAAEAQKIAFDALQKKIHAAAEETKGPWTQALDRMSTSWERAKHGLADSGWSNVLLHGLQNFADRLNQLADAIDRVNEADRRYANRNSTVTVDLPAATPATPEQEARARAAAQQPTQEQLKARDAVRDEIRLQQELANATSDADRIRIAGEQAYRKAMDETKDATIAQMRADAARQQMQLEIQRQRRQSLLGTAEGFIGRRENSRADSAVLESLFNQFGIKSPSGVTLDPQKVAWCAAFVNAVLAANGVQGTGSLAAKSFNNFGTAVTQPEKGDIVIIKGGTHVGFFEGFAANGGVQVLGGNQGKPGQGAVSIETFNRSAVTGFRRVGNVPEGNFQSEFQAQQQLAQQQDSFNQSLAVESAQRQLALKFLRDQLGVSAEKVFASQREQTIQTAIADKERQAREQGLAFGDKQKQQIRDEIGQQFDLQHGEERINAVLQEQQSLREALLQGIAQAEQRGDTATVNRLKAALGDTDTALQSAIDAAIKFWSQFDSPEAKAAIERLRQLRGEVASTAAQLAKIHLDNLNQHIGGGEQLQNALKDQIGQQQVLGDSRGARESERALEGVNLQLIQMRQNAIDAAQAMLQMSDQDLAAIGQTREGLQAFILQQQQAQRETAMMGRQFLMTGQQINEMIADNLVSGIENFITMVAQGRNVFESLGIAALQTAADILKSLGEMILKQAIFNAIAGSSGMGGIGGSLAASIGLLFPAAVTLGTAGGTLTAAGGTLMAAGGLWQATAAELMAAANMLIVANSMSFAAAHTGGIAGFPTMHRSVSPLVFAGARRFHSGGLPGLRSNEVPTILERGEEVLTEDNPRHIKNQRGGSRGGMGGGDRGIKQVLLMDKSDLAAAMSDSEGRKVVLTHIRQNAPAIKAMLDGNG